MVVGLYVGFATVAGFVIWYTNTSFMGIDLSQVSGSSPVALIPPLAPNEIYSCKFF
jgi:hypothetical protein